MLEIERDKEKDVNFPRTLVLGGGGFVGSAVLGDFNEYSENLISPRSKEVNILDYDSVVKAIKETNAKVLVNFAAYTNVREAAKQKSEKENGEVWKVNVGGIENLIKACQETGSHLVQTSTDNVFLGKRGPFNENDELVNMGSVDWYGYTKRVAEDRITASNIKYSIVRIGYPFGAGDSQKDYLLKMLKTIRNDYPLFTDQYFTPTYIPDLSKALKVIISNQITGKFHSVSAGLTTPYEIGSYFVKEAKLDLSVKEGLLYDYERKYGKTAYNPNGGLNISETQSRLGIKFLTWQEAVKDFICNVHVE